MDTPSFFLSAWNSDYTPRFHQGLAENHQLDYFLCKPAYQARHLFQLRDDSDQIIKTLNPSLFDKGAATAELEPVFGVFTQTAPMQGIATCASPSVFSITSLGIP
jgi:hypothetical protein